MLKNRKKRKKDERRRNSTSVDKKSKATGEIQEATSSHTPSTEKLALDQAFKYKNMAQSYWERWQWELTQRKYQQAKGGASPLTTPTASVQVQVPEIDPLQLFNPNGIEESETLYVGRGSFGTAARFARRT